MATSSTSGRSFVANGNIFPCRFVCGVTGSPFKVIAAVDSTLPILGVSQQGTLYAPGTAADSGYAATSGYPLQVFGLGEECLIEVGAAGVTCDDYLTAGTAGVAVTVPLTATAHREVGALALETGTSGQKIRARVVMFGGTQA